MLFFFLLNCEILVMHKGNKHSKSDMYDFILFLVNFIAYNHRAWVLFTYTRILTQIYTDSNLIRKK